MKIISGFNSIYLVLQRCKGFRFYEVLSWRVNKISEALCQVKEIKKMNEWESNLSSKALRGESCINKRKKKKRKAEALLFDWPSVGCISGLLNEHQFHLIYCLTEFKLDPKESCKIEMKSYIFLPLLSINIVDLRMCFI